MEGPAVFLFFVSIEGENGDISHLTKMKVWYLWTVKAGDFHQITLSFWSIAKRKYEGHSTCGLGDGRTCSLLLVLRCLVIHKRLRRIFFASRVPRVCGVPGMYLARRQNVAVIRRHTA